MASKLTDRPGAAVVALEGATVAVVEATAETVAAAAMAAVAIESSSGSQRVSPRATRVALVLYSPLRVRMRGMTSGRARLLAGLLAIAAVLLFLWALSEARRQRRDVEAILTAQATVLARSLGPGLVAASHAARELDEIVLWKLLDNARLFAALGPVDQLDPLQLEDLADANGLDSVVFFDTDGRILITVGEPAADFSVEDLSDILEGQAEEIVVGAAKANDPEHIGAASALPEGGAVLVRIHPSSARAFARRLGVENLLSTLVGTGGVLYLGYSEEPSGRVTEVTWDNGPLPESSTSAEPISVRGRTVFEVELPIESPAGSTANLRVGLDGDPLHEAAAASMRRTLLVSIVLAGFAVAGIGFAMVSRLRAIERQEASQQVAAAEAARRRSERLAAAGALTAGLAHEVRSPMNAIGLAAQRLERKLEEGDERRSIAQRIREELQRLEGILREFLDLASPVSDSRETVDLRELASQVAELMIEEANAEAVSLQPVAGSGSVVADREAVRRAIINLVRNAIQASPREGRVIVRVDEQHEHVILTVTDEGPGLDPKLEERAFDAFVTGRASGTGLGLAMVRRVAEEHDGSVSLINRAQGGAEARLELPHEKGIRT